MHELPIALREMIESAKCYIRARIIGRSVPFDPSPMNHDAARAARLAGLLQAGKIDPGPTFVLPTDDPKKFLMVTELKKS